MTVANLEYAGGGVQLALPLEGRVAEALDLALDELRERFRSRRRAGDAGRARIAPGGIAATRRRATSDRAPPAFGHNPAHGGLWTAAAFVVFGRCPPSR